MAPWTGETSQIGAGPGWGISVLAGAGAGVAAAFAAVGIEAAMHSPLPPRTATLWSAFVAGVLGGIVYAWLGRMSRRPATWLWAISLTIATIDSLLIADVPLPSGRGPSVGIPIAGLLVPLRQLLTFLGIGHLGIRYFPKQYLSVSILTHYVTAVAVSALVPLWVRGRRRNPH
jgi:hypothetical protein